MRAHFQQRGGPQALGRYLAGLLTEHPDKSCDTLAQVVPGTPAQRRQGVLTALAWDEDDLNRQRVGRLLTLPTEGDAVLTFDDTGFAEPGQCSVGVARQYSGTLGKTANCQVAVNCHDAARTIAWSVAARLDLHERGANGAARCRKAKVPEAVTIRTKPATALALLDQARAWGVPQAGVVAGADYGDHPHFLAGRDERRGRDVAAVRRDFAVVTRRRPAEPTPRAEGLLEALPGAARRAVRWRGGSKGGLRGRSAALRCRRVTSDGRRHRGWLIGAREAAGRGPRRRSSWSDFGPGMALATRVGSARRRHRVGRYHEKAKGSLGWDQY